MKKKLVKLHSLLMIFSLIMLVSCGPSAQSKRDDEVQDSLEMEQERLELLDRANKILENNTSESEENRLQSDSIKQ